MSDEAAATERDDAPPAEAVASEAAYETGLIEPALEPPRGLVATTLVVLAAVAMLAVWWAPPAHVVDRGPADLSALAVGLQWEVEAELLDGIEADDAALLARAAAGGAAWQQAEAQLQAEVAAVLAEEVTVGAAGLADVPAARDRVAEVEERVRQLALAHGRDAVQSAALRWAQRVVAALLPVAQAAAQAQGNWSAALASPAGKAAEALAPGLATALASAHVERWVTPAGWQRAAGLALQALARQRFLAFSARVPAAQPLPEQTALLLLRWKAETHDGLGLERRVGLLQQLRARDATYPAEFHAARLYWQAERCDAALPLLAEAIATGQRVREARLLQSACLQQPAAADRVRP